MIAKHEPALLPRLSPDGNLSITADEAERLQFAISGEMCAKGLRDDSEPNDYGLALDDLIGVLCKAVW
jgi:hypothetical protein